MDSTTGPADVYKYHRHLNSSERNSYYRCSCGVKSGCSRLHSWGFRQFVKSSIRNRCSQCRKSPLKPGLSATWNAEIAHRSICLPDLAARSPIDTDATCIGEPRIYRSGLIRAGSAAFRASLACNITMRLVIRTTSANIREFRWTGYDLML